MEEEPQKSASSENRIDSLKKNKMSAKKYKEEK